MRESQVFSGGWGARHAAACEVCLAPQCSRLPHHCCEGPGWETRLPPHGATWGPLIWAFSAPRKSDIRMHTHTEVSEEFARLPQRSFRDLSLLIKLGPFPSYLAGGGRTACGSSSCRRTSHLPGLTDLHPPGWHQGPGTLTCRDGPAALHPGTLMIRSEVCRGRAQGVVLSPRGGPDLPLVLDRRCETEDREHPEGPAEALPGRVAGQHTGPNDGNSRSPPNAAESQVTWTVCWRGRRVALAALRWAEV